MLFATAGSGGLRAHRRGGSSDAGSSVYEDLEAESANYGAALADGFDSDGGGRKGFRDLLRRGAGVCTLQA